MLNTLKIKQFVIIEEQTLDFRTGLTIFTGETGAGKSIILGAMALILGEPSNTESIRQGQDESIFEANFSPPSSHVIWTFLKENNLAEDGDKDFTIYRVMRQDGKDDIRVNGKPIEQKLLKKMGELLAEIHGQFANQSLLGPENQLNLLDLSGSFPREVFENVEKALKDVDHYKIALEEEKKFLAHHKGPEGRKVEVLFKRFDAIGMKKGFIEHAVTEHAKLRTAKETGEAFQSMLGRLIATNGVVGSLAAANNTLAMQKNLDKKKMVKLAEYLSVGLQNARDAVEEMGRLLPEYEIDTGPLHRYEKILRVLRDIGKENKVTFSDLEDFYLDTASKLDRIRNGRENLIKMEEALQKAKKDYLHHAHILTEKRTVAGEELSKSITKEFIPLMLNKAEFQVQVEEKTNMEWTNLGINEVTFIARMNPGSPFTPISETASGGELARMILALKVVLQLVQVTPTLVFDEVDTGIGGAAAAAVGERIAYLAETTQVLVITHSPQVASRGDQHLHISKTTDGVTTLSSVRELTDKERIDEISRMLAGDKSTEASEAAAQSLIDEARSAAAERRKNL